VLFKVQSAYTFYVMSVVSSVPVSPMSQYPKKFSTRACKVTWDKLEKSVSSYVYVVFLNKYKVIECELTILTMLNMNFYLLCLQLYLMLF